MSYEHGQKQVPKTIDQLKRLNIPSEMLRFFNHACPPRMCHPTRLVHSTPHEHTLYTTYERGQKQVPKTMDQLKCLSIPLEMLRFFNHVCPPRMGHPTRSVHSTPHEHTLHTTYECDHKQVPITMDQIKCLSIPSEMLRFFNHACPP